MPKHSQPRRGSLQYWPRKRASKILPSVNWQAISKNNSGLLGFIVYKVGMKSALVKDNTEHSLTKGKKITVPVTIFECPPLKILSVRFYKHNKIVKEIFVGGEKELKKKVKLAKKKEEKKINLDEVKDYTNIHLIVYSLVNRTGIKKSPDLAEIGLAGSKDEQLAVVKNFLNKEISIEDVFKEGLADVRGLTKGKGTQGPVKRFGISLRVRKSEKGVRKVGSIGPWHPARVTFRVPAAGQLGFFTRINYNNKIISIGKISEKNINPKGGWKHYGDIKTDYIILQGSVSGPQKRQLLLTTALRPWKKQLKKNFEFEGLR
jgi:large subunit ribosomal protein L3